MFQYLRFFLTGNGHFFRSDSLTSLKFQVQQRPVVFLSNLIEVFLSNGFRIARSGLENMTGTRGTTNLIEIRALTKERYEYNYSLGLSIKIPMSDR